MLHDEALSFKIEPEGKEVIVSFSHRLGERQHPDRRTYLVLLDYIGFAGSCPEATNY